MDQEIIGDCVLWEGAINSAGYPVTWFNNKIEYKHRLVAGAGKGDTVMHICDVKSCINPLHLKIGTPKQNSEDMVKKGRQAVGEKAGNSWLTESQVKDILSYKGEMSSRKTATLFGCSKTNILDIWNKRIWRHI